MATLNASTLKDTVYSGESGLNPAHGSYALAAANINDKVRLNLLYAGTKVYDAKLINAALGSGVTVDLGFEYANGEAGSNATQWLAAAACTNAGANRSAAAPIVLPYDAYVIATIKGAAATGQIDSVITYEFVGK